MAPLTWDTCKGICGDAIILPSEGCDDGNHLSGDGCTYPGCLVETGWTCSVIAPKTWDTCSPTCGDGVIEGSETCDDHNTTPNDGCSSSC